MISRFRFKQIGDRYLVTNDLGYFMWLTNTEFEDLCNGYVVPANRPKFRREFFLIDDINTDDARYELKNYATKFYGAPNTYILKFTNACTYNCVYCQASSDRANGDQMCTIETAKHVVDLMLSAPVYERTLEIQGGEPTLNWNVIKECVLYCEHIRGKRRVKYRMMSNLATLTEDMIEFCKEHKIHIGTSIDGPKIIHDINRPACNGCSSFDQTYSKFSDLRYTRKVGCGFLSTVTRESLQYAEEIAKFSVDKQGHYNCRPLFKLGKAVDNWDEIGYTPEEFLEYYKTTVKYCLDRYIAGDRNSLERNLIMKCNKILRHTNGDIENNSPCGAIQCMVSIDWNGDVVACEGSKMLREPNRSKFVIGNVNDPNFNFIDLFFNNGTQQLITKMFSTADVRCANCVYLPYCGNCAVERTMGDACFTTFNCAINEGSFDFIFDLLQDPVYYKAITEWLDTPIC